jgi:hypothetical protein
MHANGHKHKKIARVNSFSLSAASRPFAAVRQSHGVQTEIVRICMRQACVGSHRELFVCASGRHRQSILTH